MARHSQDWSLNIAHDSAIPLICIDIAVLGSRILPKYAQHFAQWFAKTPFFCPVGFHQSSHRCKAEPEEGSCEMFCEADARA